MMRNEDGNEENDMHCIARYLSLYKITIGLSAAMIVLTTSLATADDVTFASHIANIMFDKCSACHRPGQAGPFPFIDL